MTAESLSKERLRLWLRMLRVTRQVESELRERLRTEHDSTLPRFDVMAALYASAEGLKMNELSKRLRVSNGNVTGIIDRLVEDGAVERIAIEGDRRATRVCLTSSGRESFSAMAVEHERWINKESMPNPACSKNPASTVEQLAPLCKLTRSTVECC